MLPHLRLLARRNMTTYLRIEDEHPPRDVADAAERVDDVRAHFAGDVFDVVLAHARPVHGPVAEVAHAARQPVRRGIGRIFLADIARRFLKRCLICLQNGTHQTHVQRASQLAVLVANWSITCMILIHLFYTTNT